MDIEYADPYDGQLLGADDDLVGHETLEVAEDLHRRLAIGETGSVVTGSCAIALVFFALSGLYLRWPRQALDWRTWLVPRWRQRGRPFLISLHSVAGTWVLLAYLSSALTGLWFGFDWYRKGMEGLLGVEAPARQGLPPMRERADPLPDLRAVWSAFEHETAASGWQSASFNVPPPGSTVVTMNYLVAHPPHERANNRLLLDTASGEPRGHERYADKSAGSRLAASFFPLHRGSYWGVGGVIVIGLASLTMPLFAVTGWMLYLRRRRAAPRPASSVLSGLPESPSPPVAPPPA
jgi:sulfite reductase (NADPH) flavoprotein alpha-component